MKLISKHQSFKDFLEWLTGKHGTVFSGWQWMVQVVTANGITFKYLVQVAKTCPPALKSSDILCEQSCLSSKGCLFFEKENLKCIAKNYIKKRNFPLQKHISVTLSKNLQNHRFQWLLPRCQKWKCILKSVIIKWK